MIPALSVDQGTLSYSMCYQKPTQITSIRCFDRNPFGTI